MEIMIHATGMELDDEISRAIHRQIQRIAAYTPRMIRARVQLHQGGPGGSLQRFSVRVLCELPGQDLYAEHRAADLLSALNNVAAKLQRGLCLRQPARLAGQERPPQPRMAGCQHRAVRNRSRWFPRDDNR